MSVGGYHRSPWFGMLASRSDLTSRIVRKAASYAWTQTTRSCRFARRLGRDALRLHNPCGEQAASRIWVVASDDRLPRRQRYGSLLSHGGQEGLPRDARARHSAGSASRQGTGINAGISGQTTTEGLARLDRDVLKHKPHLVTISFGLNDVTRLSEAQFEQNLKTLIEKCRSANAQVVLCTPNAVMDTDARPISKLTRYCERIRAVGQSLKVPVCDQFAAGERLQAQDAFAWRLTMSDEIHPNMDGHKRMAEELCRTITAKEVSLAKVGPPRDFLRKTKELLKDGKPVKVLAMPPYDAMIVPALKQLQSGGRCRGYHLAYGRRVFGGNRASRQKDGTSHAA
jgi:lysophospholipase L1-like esterase